MIPAPRARSAHAWPLAAALAAVVVAPALGCRRDIHLLPLVAVDNNADGDAAGAADGATDGEGALDAGPACTGLGPPIMLPTGTVPTCAAALATRGHRFAVCTCDALTLAAGSLRTDAFDSTNSSVSDVVSAAVGTDGALATTQPNVELRAGGAIYVANPFTGVVANGHLQAGASFRSAGPLTVLSPQHADLLADAYVDGNVTGTVNVGGTLYVPSTATVATGVKAPTVTTATFSVPPPCDCTAGFVDVNGAILAAAASNGDAAAGFGPDALAGALLPAQLTLGCGTYFLSAVNSSAPVSLVVHGRALLAVQASVTLGGGLTVKLDPSAELDLLVGNWFTASGTVGAADAPARFRIWIAGSDSLAFDDQPTIAAVVHAPNAPATASEGLTVSGSLFVKSLALGDDAQVHYDRAILSVGADVCGEPTATAPP